MNTTKILQNSWNLMLRYRALWLFGVILALTTVSFGSALWLRDNDEPSDRTPVNWEISARDQLWIKENFGLDLPLTYQFNGEDLGVRLDDPLLSTQEKARLATTALTILAVLLILIVVTWVLRYTAETALIRMVDDQQYKDIAHTTRQGWSLGLSIAAFKLFLIDLVVIPLLIALTGLIFLPALLPLFLVVSGSTAGITIGILLMISLSLVSVAALIVMWIGGMVTLRLARRATCLEGLGVFASIWRGFRLMRAQLRGIGMTWLVVVGLDLVYPIVIAPVGFLLAAASLAVSGLLSLIVGALLALFLAKSVAWTIALSIGGVLLVLAAGVPMILLSGLKEVFTSSAWTLTFREAASAQSAARIASPQPALPQAGQVAQSL